MCFPRVVLVYLVLWKYLPRAIFCCICSLCSCSGRKRASSFEVWKSGTILESCTVELLVGNPFVWLLSSGLIISFLESLMSGTGICPSRFLILCLIFLLLCSGSEQSRESGFNVCSSEVFLESWEVKTLPDLFEHIISVGYARSKPVCFVVTVVGFGLTEEVELLPWRSREPGSGGIDETSPFLKVTNSEVVLEPGDARSERDVCFSFFPFLQTFCRDGCNILQSTNAIGSSDSNHKWQSLRLNISRIFLLCRSKRSCDKEHSQAVLETTDGQMWRYGHESIWHLSAGFE